VRLLLLVLLPVWLPILAAVVVYSLAFAPAPASPNDGPSLPDHDLPDDFVPPLARPRSRSRQRRGATTVSQRRPPNRAPAPGPIAAATSTTIPPKDLTAPLARCWSMSFPAG
jgi:hypothetical protein